jgi:hypothetical protein
MNDPLANSVELICREAETHDLRVFYGSFVNESRILTVHWDTEHGGDWKKFVGIAKLLNAQVLYVSREIFEEADIADAVETHQLGDEIAEEDLPSTDTIKSYQSKVGMTCMFDLAFCANGVLHTYQETAVWFDEFQELVEEEEESPAQADTIPDAEVGQWATKLASDPRYCTSSDHSYLLEQIAGSEYPRLPAYRIRLKAEAIYRAQFKQEAELRLANEISELRQQGLNLKAIALKLGLSQSRVSGLASLAGGKKNRTG